MRATLLSIGAELLLGRIVDTNAPFIARELARVGIETRQVLTVGDRMGDLVRAFETSLAGSDVVVASGGLGPTVDDRSRPALARALGRPLLYRRELFAPIRERFRGLNLPIPANNRRQAYLPEGTEAIPNPRGTAPGIRGQVGRCSFFLVPGVPREMEAMLHETVLPWLVANRGAGRHVLRTRTLMVQGLSESRVDELVRPLLTGKVKGVQGALTASRGLITLALTAEGPPRDVDRRLEQAMELGRAALGRRVLVEDGGHEALRDEVGRRLEESGLLLSLEEIGTGGGLCRVLADVPGFTGTVRPAGSRRAGRAGGAAGGLRVLLHVPLGDRDAELVIEGPHGRLRKTYPGGQRLVSCRHRLVNFGLAHLLRYLRKLHGP